MGEVKDEDAIIKEDEEEELGLKLEVESKDEDKPGVVKSLTLVDRKTGMRCGTVVIKKGNIAYVVQMCC